LESFLVRLANRQPLAAPQHAERYFVTRFEAAQICMLSAFLGPHQHVLFPDLDAAIHLTPLAGLAEAIIRNFGLEPVIVHDEAAALAMVESEIARGHYPLLLTPLDTSGEKPFEEFIGAGETAVPTGMRSLKAIPHNPTAANVGETVAALESLIGDPNRIIEKDGLVEILRAAVPTLRHVETGHSLDQRL